jgi:serine/threonine kinase PknH
MSREQSQAPPESGLGIFVSYARDDKRSATALVAHLADSGHRVWWDQSLVGRQDWWATILERIRSCHVFIIVVSPASLASAACEVEIRYAAELGRPLLPVMVEAVSPQLLPPVVAAHQLVDYRRAGTDARRALRLALEALPQSPPAPVRFPPAPPAPGADLNEVASVVGRPQHLSVEAQHDVLLRLRFALGRPDYRDTARKLLIAIRTRPELTQQIAGEIASTLAWLDGGYERGPRHVAWMYVGMIFTVGLLGIVLGALNMKNPAWRPHAHVLLTLGIAWGIFCLVTQWINPR